MRMLSWASCLNHSFCLIAGQGGFAHGTELLSGMKKLAEEPATIARRISELDHSTKMGDGFV